LSLCELCAFAGNYNESFDQITFSYSLIRLYEKGEAEFENFPAPKMNALSYKLEKLTLNEPIVRQIKTFIEVPDFLNAKTEYPPSKLLLDLKIIKTITYMLATLKFATQIKDLEF
jgi:hypothetical protein